MKYAYTPRGVCSSKIEFDLDEETKVVSGVSYRGGCSGNLQAVSRLVEGMPAEQVLEKLSGIHCGFKSTSCADQLTCAVAQALKAQEAKGKL